MRIFIAAMVAAFGIGAFAAAALVWDRRRHWRLTGRATAGWVSGLLFVGLALVVGSCLGLIQL